MQIDGRSMSNGARVESDVCIVGAGAAGITLARELLGRGIRVCLVESGGLDPDPATQDLARGEARGQQYQDLKTCRLRFFGGTTNHWRGWCRPLDVADLDGRPWVPGTGWPIGHSDLHAYYARAHQLCELGPFDYRVESWLDNALPQPFPFDAARVRTTLFQLSPPTRFGARYRDEVLGAPWSLVLLHSTAVELLANSSARRVDSVRVATLAGNRFSVEARLYVLAGGGIENARLLLASRSVNPSGLGNDSDLVGRRFMEHLHLRSGLLLPTDVRLDGSLYTGVRKHGTLLTGALVLPEARLREEAMASVSVTLEPTGRLEAPFIEAEQSRGVTSLRALWRAGRRGRTPDDFVRHLWNVVAGLDDVFRVGYVRAVRPTIPGSMFALSLRSEQVPNPTSRVTLAEERDPLGVPRPRLEWRLTELDLHTLRRMQEILALEVGRAGIGRVFLPPGEEARAIPVQGGCHHMGTTRMDPSPAKGVVDPNARVHGMANLYVAGSSVFPSVGFSHPTLTIVALTLRLADHVRAVLR